MKAIKLKNVLPFEKLYQEYINRHKTDEQIANKYGFCKETIRKYRQNLGITRYVLSSEHEKKLCQEDKEILLGSFLGDLYITKQGDATVTHSEKQYAYLKWLHYKLKNISQNICRTSQNKFYFKTVSLDFLKQLRKTYYVYDQNAKRCKKIINVDLLNKLTPLSLSIWFCDDGYVDNGCNYHLSTHGFSLSENQIIQKYFLQKWNIQTQIAETFSIKYNQKYFHIKMNKINSIKFTEIIKYYLIPSMLYKLIKSERKHIIYLAGAMQYSPDGGKKWRRNLKSLLNDRGYYCIDPTKEEDVLLLEDGWKNSLSNNFNKFQKNMQTIINHDLYFVDMSDHVICNYDDFAGGGTFHEIGECFLKKKNLYLLNLKNIPLHKMSWWALGCCTKVVSSYEGLLNCFPQIGSNNVL